MTERTPRIPDDTYVMLGSVEHVRDDHISSKVITLTRAQIDLPERLCGWRAHWAIVFGEYDQEWIDTVLKPMLVAATPAEVKSAQEGHPILNRPYPVIRHVPVWSNLLKAPTHE